MGAQTGPGAIPAERRDAAKELIRRGTSYAEVQRITGVSAGTCTNIRRELEREGQAGLAGAHRARQVAPAEGAPPPQAPVQPESPPATAPRSREAPGCGIGDDFAALAEQERDVEDLIAAARGRADYAALERLTRVRIDLRRGMAQLRPPPPVNPEADVANVEAARLLVARLRKMIVAKRGPA